MRKVIIQAIIGSFICFFAFLPSAFANPPQRIISGMPSITEMLFALGLEDQIAGVTTNCNYPPQALKKEKIGGFFLNLEKVVSLKPDLVVMLEDAQPKDIERFKEYGLPVYTINPRSVDGVMDSLLALGEVTGKKEAAKKIVKEMKRRIAAVEKLAAASRPNLFEILKIWREKPLKRKALVIVGFNPLIVAGGDTYIDDIIRVAGLENIAGQTKAAYPQYSFERLLEEDPYYIIIPAGVVALDQIIKDSRWQSLGAVKNNRILFIGADILSRPGPRVALAIEEIARFVYEKKT